MLHVTDADGDPHLSTRPSPTGEPGFLGSPRKPTGSDGARPSGRRVAPADIPCIRAK
jgi:hypothetical protein